MDIATLDLNLLRVFNAIMTTGSLTAGGEGLQLSQPAMSNALTRLRAQFDDPLFVRSGQGMKPTDYASAIAGPIHDALEALDRSLRTQAKFDPSRAERLFHLCTTDVGSLVLLPPFLKRLEAVAPDIRLKVGQYAMREIREMFSSGELDLAIGFMPELGTGIYQQRLFDDRYVVIARANHPRVGKRISAEQYARESHVVVQSPGTGHSTLKDVLAAAKCRVRLEVRDFACAPMVVATTDLIATVPSRHATLCEPQLNLQVFDHPLDLPAFPVKQFWHERNHHDPASIWLRNQVAELYGYQSAAYALTPMLAAQRGTA